MDADTDAETDTDAGCIDVPPRGGDGVGIWNVTSSCLTVTDKLDTTNIGWVARSHQNDDQNDEPPTWIDPISWGVSWSAGCAVVGEARDTSGAGRTGKIIWNVCPPTRPGDKGEGGFCIVSI